MIYERGTRVDPLVRRTTIMLSHRELLIFACFLVIALAILVYAQRITETSFMGIVGAIVGYILRDRVHELSEKEHERS